MEQFRDNMLSSLSPLIRRELRQMDQDKLNNYLDIAINLTQELGDLYTGRNINQFNQLFGLIIYSKQLNIDFNRLRTMIPTEQPAIEEIAIRYFYLLDKSLSLFFLHSFSFSYYV